MSDCDSMTKSPLTIGILVVRVIVSDCKMCDGMTKSPLAAN